MFFFILYSSVLRIICFRNRAIEYWNNNIPEVEFYCIIRILYLQFLKYEIKAR
jgi:hypothetical protein